MKKTTIGILIVVISISILLWRKLALSKADVEALQKKVAALQVQLTDSERRPAELSAVAPKNAVSDIARDKLSDERAPNLPSAKTESEASDQRDQINARRAFRIAAGMHAEAISKLQLDPATASKVVALYAEALRVQIDTGAAARKAGITNSEEIKRLAMQETAKVDLEIQQALGPALFQALGEESAIFQEKRLIDLGFSQELTVTGDGLSAEQSYALARAVFQLKAGATSGRYLNSELLDSPQFEAATKLLSAKQVEAFKRYYRDGAELDALAEKRAIKP